MEVTCVVNGACPLHTLFADILTFYVYVHVFYSGWRVGYANLTEHGG